MTTIPELRISNSYNVPPLNALGKPLVGQNSNPVIFRKGADLNTAKSMSAAYSNIARLVTTNEKVATGIVKTFNEDITLSDALDKLSKENDYNDAMKSIVLESVNSASNDKDKIAVLEKGLAFLETEKQLNKCVQSNKMDIASAKELFTNQLKEGCNKDFSLEKLNNFNENLKKSRESIISESKTLPGNVSATSDDLMEAKTIPEEEEKKQSNEKISKAIQRQAGTKPDEDSAIATKEIEGEKGPIGDPGKQDVSKHQEGQHEGLLKTEKNQAAQGLMNDGILEDSPNAEPPPEETPGTNTPSEGKGSPATFATNNDNNEAISEGTNQKTLEQQLSELIKPFTNNSENQNSVDNAGEKFERLNNLLQKNPELRNNPVYTNAVKDLENIIKQAVNVIFSKNGHDRKNAFDALEDFAKKILWLNTLQCMV